MARPSRFLPAWGSAWRSHGLASIAFGLMDRCSGRGYSEEVDWCLPKPYQGSRLHWLRPASSITPAAGSTGRRTDRHGRYTSSMPTKPLSTSAILSTAPNDRLCCIEHPFGYAGARPSAHHSHGSPRARLRPRVSDLANLPGDPSRVDLSSSRRGPVRSSSPTTKDFAPHCSWEGGVYATVTAIVVRLQRYSHLQSRADSRAFSRVESRTPGEIHQPMYRERVF